MFLYTINFDLFFDLFKNTDETKYYPSTSGQTRFNLFLDILARQPRV